MKPHSDVRTLAQKLQRDTDGLGHEAAQLVQGRHWGGLRLAYRF